MPAGANEAEGTFAEAGGRGDAEGAGGGSARLRPHPRQAGGGWVEWTGCTRLLEVRLANIASAKKRNRQNVKRRIRNRDVRSRARKQVKVARQAVQADAKSAEPAVKQAVSELDRASAKGVLHKRNAARRKSRLMKSLAKAKATK